MDEPVDRALTSAALREGMTLRRVGRKVVCLEETGSTSDVAFELAGRDGAAADGTVVFAEFQMAGRGRLGRAWTSRRGASILISIILFEPREDAPSGLVALATAVGVCAAIRDSTGIRPSVRWPNDLFVGAQKVAGVLVERRQCGRPVRWATVVGVGLNCLQQRADFGEDLADRATSLQIESQVRVNRSAVARALLAALDRHLSDLPSARRTAVISEWTALSEDIGSRVTVARRGRPCVGRIVSVEPDAGLLLQLDDDTRVFCDAATTSVIERHGRV